MISVLAGITAAATAAGFVQALAAAWLVARFARRARRQGDARPPVSVLKPLHGHEPLLEAALATICQQDYPEFQVVFGVQDANDPAAGVVRRLQTRFPDHDIALVVDPAQHGVNRKVGNLINMMPAARHDVLVIADSDVHARVDYLDSLVAALAQPGIGLVTTLYAGLAANRAGLVQSLGATQITHGFLPGAVLARALGREDCLGATMCLRRQDLVRIGGLRSLVDHLADDNILGRRIADLGLSVALADTVVLTTVAEANLKALFSHELRWARTVRALEPAGFAASIVQYPLAWALLALAITGGADWAAGLFFGAWMVRAAAAFVVDRALMPQWSGDHAAALAFRCPVWLLPVRDVLSVAVMVASYGGRQVDWRGHALRAGAPPPSDKLNVKYRPIEGINAR